MQIKPRLSIRRARVFVTGLDHPECVCCSPSGKLYAGGEAGQIYEISPDGRRKREIACTGGFILGVAVSPDGTWLAICDEKHKCVWRLELRTRKLRLFARTAGTHRIVLPNHLIFSRNGSLYVTDSGSFGKASGKILRFDADHSGKGHVWHPGPFKFANGVGLFPDESTLLVVCSLLPGVEQINIRADGTAGSRRAYLRLPRTVPDGILVDRHNTVYITCYAPNRIYRVSKGMRVGHLIEDWFAHTLTNPTNICFRDKRQRELFAANLGSSHITCIRL